jgi:RNA polymerase primary sigma factor
MGTAARRRTFDSGRDVLTEYLDEIRRYPLMSREQEVAIARRIHDGDVDAVNALVCANLRFVVSVAKKYQNQGVSLSDLINEGNLGLMRAAHRFDETKGIKFISYAVWWIRQSVLQALAEQSRIMRVPLNRAGTLHRIGRHTSALQQELGRAPTNEEIAAGMNMTEEEVEMTVAIAQTHLSLDAPLTPGEESRLLDYLPDTTSPTPDEEALDQALMESIHEALASLKEREARVLALYFGLEGQEPTTLEEIGASLGITRERVRQIKEKALARLRRAKSAKALTAWSSDDEIREERRRRRRRNRRQSLTTRERRGTL